MQIDWVKYSFVFLSLVCAGALLASVAEGQEEKELKQATVDELIELLKSPSDDTKIRAAAELVNHPEKIDQFAVPLAELFASRKELVRLAAERVFNRIGEGAVDSIEPLLKSEKLLQFQHGCSAVNAIGDPAKKWKPFLLAKLKESEDVRERKAVMFAFTGFSDGAPEAVELAVKDFDEPDFNVSLFACRLLIKTGRNAKAVLPDVVELFKNGNLSQRTYAAWTLGAIGQTDQFDTLAALTPMLDKFTLAERERALTGIGLLEADAKSLEPRVLKIMNEPGTNLEARAAFVLWQITGKTQPTVDRLVELSKQTDFELTALQMLADMGPAAVEAKEYLAERTGAKDESIRETAIEALGNMKDLASDQKQLLFELLEDPDPLVRLNADIALEKITLPRDDK